METESTGFFMTAMNSQYIGIYAISFVFMIIGAIVGGVLKSRMRKYAQIGNSSGMTGKQVAERMLEDHGIYDVEVLPASGFLSDHYNPLKKTVKLSQGIYDSPSIAAMAVAAHEVGHAVQHNTGYVFLSARSALVPVMKLTGMVQQWVILGGIILINVFPYLLLAGICLFAITTLFSIMTLPVEVNATRRALIWLKTKGLSAGKEHKMAKDGLRWAALTYFVAAIQSLATLLYYISIFRRSR